MTTDGKAPLPPLPSLLETIREAEKGLESLRERKRTEVERILTEREVPLTVRLMREARLKDKMRLAAAERSRCSRKLNRKMRTRVLARRWNNVNPKKQFIHWKKGKGTEVMTFGEWLHIFGRLNPYRSHDPDETLFVCRKKITVWRADETKPWTLDNVHPMLSLGKTNLNWTKLPLHRDVEEWKTLGMKETCPSLEVYKARMRKKWKPR